MGDPNKALRHMVDTVSRYIEHHDNIFGKGGPGLHEMPPMNRKEKGQSKPALTPAAIKYVTDPQNRRTAMVLEPLIAELADTPRSQYLGYDLYALVCRCGYNTQEHGYLRNLKTPQTHEDRIELEAWHFACWKIAHKALKKVGEERLYVRVNPRDETAENPIQARNRDIGHNRTVTARDGYKKLYGRFQAFEGEYPEASREAAKDMFIDLEKEQAKKGKREPVGKRTLERAISYMEKNEEREVWGSGSAWRVKDGGEGVA